MKKISFFSVMLALSSIAYAAPIASGLNGFRDQPYWGGKAKIIEQNGKKVLELTSSVRGSRHFGRAFLPCYSKDAFKKSEKVVATAEVRGKGKFFIGILKYSPNSGMPVTVFVDSVALSENTQKVTFAFEMEKDYNRVYPFLQVDGEGIAYIESFNFEKSNDPAIKLSVLTPQKKAAKTAKAAPAPVINLYSGISSYRDQPYWGGKAKVITVDGKKVLELTSSAKNGRHFGRAFAPFSSKELFLPESELVATARVRGKGKFFIGLLKYPPNGTGAPTVANAAPIELSETAKEVKFKFTVEKYYDRIYTFVQVDGEGTAYIESVKLEKNIDNSIKITAVTPLQIIKEKELAAPVIFTTSLKNADVNIIKINGSKTTSEKIKSDANGKITLPAAEYLPGTTHICASIKGIGVKNYVKVISQKELEQTDAIASKIKLKKPVRMLMLGDSLSDFYRGYNYIDRLSFWLNKYNPGKFTFHNAGVGGDFCERASNRMEVELGNLKKYVHRQYMYDGIFKNEYDYIFIFIGQNDTRCMPATKYEIPETTPDEQQKYLSLMVKRLKEKCPKAKIVLLSPSPSNEALFDDHLAKGRKVAFYGKKKFVDAYDQGNRKFCKENNFDYIDILTPMRNYTPLKDLYVSDGVHLSEEGGRLICEELLKYFAKENE